MRCCCRHWLLRYDVTDDDVERRAPYRADHLAHARAAHDRGELLLAGALADPADGAVLVFRTDSPEPVRALPATTRTSWRGS